MHVPGFFPPLLRSAVRMRLSVPPLLRSAAVHMRLSVRPSRCPALAELFGA
jgi:hypothetical protein